MSCRARFLFSIIIIFWLLPSAESIAEVQSEAKPTMMDVHITEVNGITPKDGIVKLPLLEESPYILTLQIILDSYNNQPFHAKVECKTDNDISFRQFPDDILIDGSNVEREINVHWEKTSNITVRVIANEPGLPSLSGTTQVGISLLTVNLVLWMKNHFIVITIVLTCVAFTLTIGILIFRKQLRLRQSGINQSANVISTIKETHDVVQRGKESEVVDDKKTDNQSVELGDGRKYEEPNFNSSKPETNVTNETFNEVLNEIPTNAANFIHKLESEKPIIALPDKTLTAEIAEKLPSFQDFDPQRVYTQKETLDELRKLLINILLYDQTISVEFREKAGEKMIWLMELIKNPGNANAWMKFLSLSERKNNSHYAEKVKIQMKSPLADLHLDKILFIESDQHIKLGFSVTSDYKDQFVLPKWSIQTGFLFNIDSKFCEDLRAAVTNKNISEGLMQEFKDNWKPLPQSAKVKYNDGWKIVDGNQEYIIKEESDKLYVYKGNEYKSFSYYINILEPYSELPSYSCPRCIRVNVSVNAFKDEIIIYEIGKYCQHIDDLIERFKSISDDKPKMKILEEIGYLEQSIQKFRNTEDLTRVRELKCDVLSSLTNHKEAAELRLQMVLEIIKRMGSKTDADQIKIFFNYLYLSVLYFSNFIKSADKRLYTKYSVDLLKDEFKKCIDSMND